MPWRGGHGNPLQGSCLENPHGQRSWHATVHGVAKSKTRLSDEAQHGKVSGGKKQEKTIDTCSRLRYSVDDLHEACNSASTFSTSQVLGKGGYQWL